MSLKFTIFLLIITQFLAQQSDVSYTISQCKENKRTVTFSGQGDLPADLVDVPCEKCESGYKLVYNFQNKKLQCQKCDSEYTNKGGDLHIDRFTEDVLKKHNIALKCIPESSGECKTFVGNEYHIVSQLSEKSSNQISFSAYSNEAGKLKIKYLKYSDSTEVFSVIVNDAQNPSYQDKSSDKIIKEIEVDVKPGDNIFILAHNNLVVKENNNSTYFKIFEITLTGRDTAALECNDLQKINNMNLDDCDYYLDCDLEEPCTEKFYTHVLDDHCDLSTGTQLMKFKLLKGAACNELVEMTSKEIKCSTQCKPGQFLNQKNKNQVKCEYCPVGYFSDGDSNQCEPCLMISSPNKAVSNVYYLKPEIPNRVSFEVIIIDTTGSVKPVYSKFNLREDLTVFVEVDGDKTYKFTTEEAGEIELTQGEHKIKILGSNINIEYIAIKGSSLGGGYKCENVSVDTQEIKRKLCEKIGNNFYFSTGYNQCVKCPLFTSYDEETKACIIEQVFENTFYHTKVNFADFLDTIEGNGLSNTVILRALSSSEKVEIQFKPNVELKVNDKIIGNEIKGVKLLRSEKDRGVIIYLKNSDSSTTAQDDPAHFIYIKCDPTKKTPEITSNDYYTGSYQVIINSSEICPICTKKEVSITSTECVDGLKTNNYTIDTDTCKQDKSNLEDKAIDFDDNGMLSTYSTDNDIEIISTRESILKSGIQAPLESDYYGADYVKEEDDITNEYLNELSEKIKCDSEKKKSISIGIIVFVCVVGFIIFIILIALYIYSSSRIKREEGRGMSGVELQENEQQPSSEPF